MLQHACAGCRRPVITRRLLTPCLWPISGDSGQWEFKTCHYYPVAPSGNKWNSNVQWRQSRPVAIGVNRCLLVAVRTHFGLRLESRNNPDRASNRILGRRIRPLDLLRMFRKYISTRLRLVVLIKMFNLVIIWRIVYFHFYFSFSFLNFILFLFLTERTIGECSENVSVKILNVK